MAAVSPDKEPKEVGDSWAGSKEHSDGIYTGWYTKQSWGVNFVKDPNQVPIPSNGADNSSTNTVRMWDDAGFDKWREGADITWDPKDESTSPGRDVTKLRQYFNTYIKGKVPIKNPDGTDQANLNPSGVDSFDTWLTTSGTATGTAGTQTDGRVTTAEVQATENELDFAIKRAELLTANTGQLYLPVKGADGKWTFAPHMVPNPAYNPLDLIDNPAYTEGGNEPLQIPRYPATIGLSTRQAKQDKINLGILINAQAMEQLAAAGKAIVYTPPLTNDERARMINGTYDPYTDPDYIDADGNSTRVSEVQTPASLLNDANIAAKNAQADRTRALIGIEDRAQTLAEAKAIAELGAPGQAFQQQRLMFGLTDKGVPAAIQALVGGDVTAQQARQRGHGTGRCA